MKLGYAGLLHVVDTNVLHLCTNFNYEVLKRYSLKEMFATIILFRFFVQNMDTLSHRIIGRLWTLEIPREQLEQLLIHNLHSMGLPDDPHQVLIYKTEREQ